MIAKNVGRIGLAWNMVALCHARCNAFLDMVEGQDGVTICVGVHAGGRDVDD